jgi:hypothetical protein
MLNCFFGLTAYLAYNTVWKTHPPRWIKNVSYEDKNGGDFVRFYRKSKRADKFQSVSNTNFHPKKKTPRLVSVAMILDDGRHKLANSHFLLAKSPNKE